MMNWSDLLQVIDKVLSAGGKKAENLYRTAVLVAIIFIFINLRGVTTNQSDNKEYLSKKIDTLSMEFAIYKETQVGNWRVADGNFKSIDDRFAQYDSKFTSYDQQLAAVRDNVFIILRGRYKMEMR